MRTLGTTAAALGLVGTIAIGTTAPAVRIGTATITAITTITVAAVEPGTAAGPAGASRAGFVIPIGVARGTSMEAARATTDIRLGYYNAAALTGGLFFAGSDGSDRSHLRREAHGEVDGATPR